MKMKTFVMVVGKSMDVALYAADIVTHAEAKYVIGAIMTKSVRNMSCHCRRKDDD